MPDGAFFVGQRQDQRFDGGRLSDRAQRLGYRLTHVAVGVREQGQQGLGYLRVAYPAEELHGAQPDFEVRVGQQAQKLGREGRVNAFGEDFSRRQAHAGFRVAETLQQFHRDLATGVFAQGMNRRDSHGGVLVVERRQQRLGRSRIIDILQAPRRRPGA